MHKLQKSKNLFELSEDSQQLRPKQNKNIVQQFGIKYYIRFMFIWILVRISILWKK